MLRILAVSLMIAGAADAQCSADRVEFRWAGGQTVFTVEIADDAAQRSRGLMFRKHLAPDAGMLFVYDHPQPVAFWMKNTLIPLDMVFIDPEGRVKLVHPDAVPGDLTGIEGPPDTVMVLEINGGLAAHLHLERGAEMRHPALRQDTVVWPCSAP